MDWTVILSFALYALCLLLPIIPAAIIFRMFPNTTIAVSGPFQNLTINATGAFAAYLVTALMGFTFLVRNTEAVIASSRQYAVECVIDDLETQQALNTISDGTYSKYDTVGNSAEGREVTRSYHFVVLLRHPTPTSEDTVWLKYWDYAATAAACSLPKTPLAGTKAIDPSSAPPGSVGPSPYGPSSGSDVGCIGPAPGKRVAVPLLAESGYPQRFRIVPDGSGVKAVKE
ncbi:MAG TPA: hypothetical protein VF753_10080 [Terriglobales bacterium]